MILNANSIVQHVTQIENRRIKHVNANVKTIAHTKKTIIGILAHVFVRIANVYKVLLVLQSSSMMKL